MSQGIGVLAAGPWSICITDPEAYCQNTTVGGIQAHCASKLWVQQTTGMQALRHCRDVPLRLAIVVVTASLFRDGALPWTANASRQSNLIALQQELAFKRTR
jgi:hypothetical protein